MNKALTIPGLSNSWTMPIRGRIDMLSTGIRTPVGLKIQGADWRRFRKIGQQIPKNLLSAIPRSAQCVCRAHGEGYFLDVTWDRRALARYGFPMEDAQNALSTAVGGEDISTVSKAVTISNQRSLHARLQV